MASQYGHSSIAIDASGNIWIADSGNNRVEEFNSTGTYLSQFGTQGSGNGQLYYPTGIAVDANGNIWVTDSANIRVEEFSPNGAYLSQFGSFGSGNGQFKSPLGIAFDFAGNIWVTDWANHNIQEFSATGTYLATFGSYGTGNGQYLNPMGIAVIPAPPPTPPIGTVLWTNSGDGSGFASIIPAVPALTGVADIFGFQNDGTVAAITSAGNTAWTANVGQYNPQTPLNPQFPSILPDFQGGLVVLNSGVGSITKLDGITGQPYPAYTAPSSDSLGLGVVHTDGTIFALQDDPNTGAAVIGINPTTGAQQFSASLAQQPFLTQSQQLAINEMGVCPAPSTFFGDPSVSSPIIAGDGYAYFAYSIPEYDCAVNTGIAAVHLWVLRISSAGAYDQIHILDVSPEFFPSQAYFIANMISNADTGILLNWSAGGSGDVFVPWPPGMAIITGTSVSMISMPTVPGWMYQNVIPVLQAQDGSFVGTVVNSVLNSDQTDMISFDATGNVRWVVPNETPQIATDDGGVIGQSGTKYDQNGNATGPSGLGANPTPGWLGNVLGTTYAVQAGALQDLAAPSTNYATTFAALKGGNASPGQGTAIQQVITKGLQTGFKQLPNLGSGPVCFPLGGPTPTCGNVNAIELLTTASPDSIFQNLIQTFAPVTTAVPPNSVMRFTGPGNSPTINVTGPGQILTISLKGWKGVLQKPFSIMTERFDPVAHTISVVTMGGHPLAGWRYWRVYSIGTNDVVIETGAYDQPGPLPRNYAGYYIAKGDVLLGWQSYLETIKFQLNNPPQGSHLQNSLGGIQLRPYPTDNGPLLQGYWDYYGDFTSYILTNVCQATSCN